MRMARWADEANTRRGLMEELMFGSARADVIGFTQTQAW